MEISGGILKNDDISAAAFQRFISQPASGRSSALPCLAAILVLSEIWRLLRLHGLFFGTCKKRRSSRELSCYQLKKRTAQCDPLNFLSIMHFMHLHSDHNLTYQYQRNHSHHNHHNHHSHHNLTQDHPLHLQAYCRPRHQELSLH